MKFGAHAFVWEGEWNKEIDERVIANAAQSDLDFVEIPLLHPESFDAARTRRLLEQYGIKATYSLGLPSEASLSEDPVGAESFLRRAVDTIAAAGGSVLTGVIYRTLGELPRRLPVVEDYTVYCKGAVCCSWICCRYRSSSRDRAGKSL